MVPIRHLFTGILCLSASVVPIQAQSFSDLSRKGVAEEREGNLDAAQIDFSQAIELKPKSAVAYDNRAITELQKNDPTSAISDFDRAIACDGGDYYALYNRGLLKFARHDWDGAMSDLNRVIAINPGHDPGDMMNDKFLVLLPVTDTFWGNLYNYRGLAKQKKGDWEGAIDDFHKAAKLDESEAAHYSLSCGNLKRDRGDLTGAITEYNAAVAADENYVPAYNNRGLVKQKMGDLDGAITDFSKAVDIDPRHAAAYQNRGLARKAKGDLAGEIADFAAAHLAVATSDEAKDKHRAASAECQVAIKLYSNYASAIHGLNRARVGSGANPDPDLKVFADSCVLEGTIMLDKGDRGAADAAFDRAVSVDPQYAGAFVGRGNALCLEGRLAEAVKDYDHAIGLDSKCDDAYLGRAYVEETLGDRKGSIADYSRAFEISSNDLSAKFNRIFVMRMQGQYSGAAADFDDLEPVDKNVRVPRSLKSGIFSYSMGEWFGAETEFRIHVQYAPWLASEQDYPHIYLWLLRIRRTGNCAAGRAVADRDMSAYFAKRSQLWSGSWPVTISSYLLGEMPEGSFLAAAGNDNAADRRSQAWYYVGMKRLFGGDQDGARDCFKRCIDGGQVNSPEYTFATTEFKRIAF
jgi:tetratricopeptide (TPR) repeat protein